MIQFSMITQEYHYGHHTWNRYWHGESMCRSSTDATACTYSMWRKLFLFWIRDVFWPQHPRCWDQNTSRIQILRHFEKKRGVILEV